MATFKSDDAAETAKFVLRLVGLPIFEEPSQVITFMNRLALRKTKPEIKLTEFKLALQACGIKNATKLREFINTQQKKNVDRQKKKLPTFEKNISSGLVRKDSGIKNNSPPKLQIKRTTSRVRLTGGGMMYVCCPVIPSASPPASPSRILPHFDSNLPSLFKREKPASKTAILNVKPKIDKNLLEGTLMGDGERVVEDTRGQLTAISVKYKNIKSN
jgi:hypothetical protein